MLSFEFGWQLFKPLIKDDLIDSRDYVFSRKEKGAKPLRKPTLCILKSKIV